jgi:hypothetical protein
MLEVTRTNLIVSFPEVHNRAALRLSFRKADAPKTIAGFAARHDSGFVLGSSGRFVLHLRPRPLAGSDWECRGLRYPFAVLVSVAGTNALTGDVANAGLTRPQNYFITPPQGGIDGYLMGGEVHPFVACGDAADDRTPMDIVVFPMKAEAFDYLARKRKLIPGPAPWGENFLLPHTGERKCEPVYENVCSLGDWDQNCQERMTVWLHGPYSL